MGDKLDILIAMAGYMLVVIFIGIYFAKRAQQSSENYFLGGRSLGPWVTAMSAEASDMSGYLLMGVPVLHTGDILRGIVDCNRSCGRYVHKLAHSFKKTSQLLYCFGRRDYRSGLFEQPFSREEKGNSQYFGIVLFLYSLRYTQQAVFRRAESFLQDFSICRITI